MLNCSVSVQYIIVFIGTNSFAAEPNSLQQALEADKVASGGQIVFQGLIVAMVKRDRWIHYLGNVMTISLGGALLLTPMLLLSVWVDIPLLYIIYFTIVVGLMFLEHLRRVKILELPWFISATWVLYRIIVLLIIL